VGFRAADVLAGRLRGWSGFRLAGAALRGDGRAGGRVVTVVKPQTYMNRSGEAVRTLLAEGFAAADLLVICDDVYLPWGRLRLRRRGGTGGHQGLESILEATGSDEFARLRIGVGPAPPSEELPDYVLAPFDEEERARLPALIDAAAGAAFDAVSEGLTQAMNRWNRFGLEPVEE
jgi:PTH1 family peptidyl-tRNA hydrolase